RGRPLRAVSAGLGQPGRAETAGAGRTETRAGRRARSPVGGGSQPAVGGHSRDALAAPGSAGGARCWTGSALCPGDFATAATQAPLGYAAVVGRDGCGTTADCRQRARLIAITDHLYRH